MNLLKRMFASEELLAIMGVMDEAAYQFRSQPMAYRIVREWAESEVSKAPANFTQTVREGLSPRAVAFHLFRIHSGELLASGQYHIYRGTLNPTAGDGLLTIFDSSLDELEKLGRLSSEVVAQQKRLVREAIAEVG